MVQDISLLFKIFHRSISVSATFFGFTLGVVMFTLTCYMVATSYCLYYSCCSVFYVVIPLSFILVSLVLVHALLVLFDLVCYLRRSSKVLLCPMIPFDVDFIKGCLNYGMSYNESRLKAWNLYDPKGYSTETLIKKIQKKEVYLVITYYYIKCLIIAILALVAIYHMFSIDKCFNIPHASTLWLLVPLPLKEVSYRYASWKQKWYNEITLRLLDNKFTAPFLKIFHLFLLYFRYYSTIFADSIEIYINMNTFALMLSIICSRLHIAGYLILFCILFLRLDFAVISMCLFYKKYPNQFVKHFPGAFTVKRGMWKVGMKVIEEASSNPKIQAVAVAVAGAVAWKALDVYDTIKQEGIATLDREASERQAAADREATKQQATADREAENSRHANTLKVETEQRELDRQAEAHQRDLDRQSAERITALGATNK